MRLTSANSLSWVEVSPSGDEHYSSFSVACAVDIGHGRFAGENVDVHLFDLPGFAEDLDRFVLDRNIRPRLEGTYGTFIEVWRPPDTVNEVRVSLAIGDAYAGSAAAGGCEFKLEGSFPIDQGHLNPLAAGFRSLAAGA